MSEVPANRSDRVEKKCKGFSALCRKFKEGELPELPDPAGYLPADPEERLELLPELLKIHLEFRIEAGGTMKGQEYFHRFSELKEHRDLALELIVNQFQLLISCERSPNLDHYLSLFPEYREELKLRLAPFQATVDPPLPARYQLPKVIDRGGMGVILRVWDANIDRPLALKLMLPSADGKRFLAEARITGQLQHPGIPPVHEIGHLADGRPFFSMKLIEGHTLDHLLRDRSSPQANLPGFLKTFEQIAQTVAYAHSLRIIHRDLKTLNVMVGAFGEVQVMDWGLAKVRSNGVETAPSVTAEGASAIHAPGPGHPEAGTEPGAVLGTPAYMPPEQARGEVNELDERCDVFALGAILCVVLTGQPLYTGESMLEVLERAKQGDLAESFRHLDASGADADLIDLAKRCLSVEREGRPRTAGEVAQAIAAHQAGVQDRLRRAELEGAEAKTRAEEERKTRGEAERRFAAERRARRRTMALATALVMLVLVISGGAVWYVQNRIAAQVRHEQAIESALEEATRPGELLEQLMKKPDRWEATLAARLAAVKRAEALTEREEGLVEPELRQRVQCVKDQVEADEKNRQLVAGFDRIRLEQSAVDVTGRAFRVKEAYPKLCAALDHHGVPVGIGVPHEAAARIKQRPKPVQSYLEAALIECRRWAPDKEGEWLEAVLTAVDPDPWRRQVLTALGTKNEAALVKLTIDPAVDKLPPYMLFGLARSLPDSLSTSRISLLRRAQQRYPDDFWINFYLAGHLHQSVLLEGVTDRKWAADEQLRLDDAVRFYTVALALRPRNSAVYVNLGTAWSDKGYPFTGRS